MTKNDVINFLNTASAEVFSDIKTHMAQIVRDRKFQEYLAKEKTKEERIKKICDLYESGMTFKQIGEIFDISGGRCQQIYKKYLRKFNRES
jgi:DNA-directed RNA polymerase specialized sigma subunit